MKGLLVAHTELCYNTSGGNRVSLSLIWVTPHYLAVASRQCEMCPTECFVSLPCGAWSHLSLLPGARHASTQTQLPIQGRKTRQRKTQHQCLTLYPFSVYSRGFLCTQPPIIQRCGPSSESKARCWLNLPIARYSVLTDWRGSHNS